MGAPDLRYWEAHLTTAYCTSAELRTQIEKTGVTGSASDNALYILINAASQVIDRYFNRPDGFFIAGSIDAIKYYAGLGKSYTLIDECVSITQVAVKESVTDTTYTTWAAGDWQAFSGDPMYPNFNDLPYNGIMTLPGGSYSDFTSGLSGILKGFRPHPDDVVSKKRVPTVKITAKWGYSVAVPSTIKQATIAFAARWFKRGQSSWSDVVASQEMGSLLYTSREFNDIKAMLESMRMYKPAIGR